MTRTRGCGVCKLLREGEPAVVAAIEAGRRVSRAKAVRLLADAGCAVSDGAIWRHRKHEAVTGAREPAEAVAPRIGRKAVLGKLAELLERNGIEVEEIGKVERVNVWQGFYKDAEGVAHTVDMAGVALSPKWAEGPAWPVVQRAPKVSVRGGSSGARRKLAEPWRRVAILPDMQIGYYRDPRDGLHPIHDEAAIEVAFRVCEAAGVEEIVFLGDNFDAVEVGKYRSGPAWQRTTQAALDRVAEVSAWARRVVGKRGRLVYLAGNHEERLPNFVLDNAAAAFGLRRAGRPAEWPVLSVPYLCRLEEHGVEFVAGWPANRHWINQRLVAVHGHLVSSRSTAHAYLERQRVSIVYGHIHRREWAEVTRENFGESSTVVAFSPGCLARVDGAVPSTKSGRDADGMPVRAIENWQQGLAIVDYVADDGRFTPHQVPIFDEGKVKWATWHDSVIEVPFGADFVPAPTGAAVA